MQPSRRKVPKNVPSPRNVPRKVGVGSRTRIHDLDLHSDLALVLVPVLALILVSYLALVLVLSKGFESGLERDMWNMMMMRTGSPLG